MPSSALEKYRTLAEAVPDAIFLVDLSSSQITEINEQTERLLGYDESAVVGMPVTEIHPTEDTDQYWELFQQVSSEERVRFDSLPDGSQVFVVTAEGEQVPVEVHAKRVDIDGRPHMFAVVRDVTDRVRRRERLERRTEELAVLNRLVRHDIRNDMGVILGWADRLTSADAEERAEIVERIQDHGTHVISLTDLARDYVEVITGDAELDPEPTALDTVLGDEVLAASERYPDADIGYTDGSDTDHTVLATPLLESVFRNLLNNAVQHNDAGTARVRVDVETDDDTLTVCVADNGPGVPDEQRETIFGRGEQGLDSTGTGIGLYLVERLVSQFGGAVHVEERDPSGFPLPGDDERPTDDPYGSVFVVELRTEAQ